MLKEIFAYLFVLSFSINLLAQNQDSLDSLQNMLKSNISEKEKVDVYVKIAHEYSNSDSLNTAKYVDKAILLAGNITYPEGKLDALYEMAWTNIWMGYYKQAEVLCQKIIQESESIAYQNGKSIGLDGLGHIAYNEINYEKALAYYFKSLEIKEGIKDRQGMAHLYNDIGIIYYYLSNYEKALTYYFHSLEINKALGFKSGMASSYNNIGLIYYDQNNYEKALEYYLQSLKINQELGAQLGIAVTCNNIGYTYMYLGDYEKALECNFKALEIAKSIDYKKTISWSYIGIGEIYKRQEQLVLAQQYLKQGLRVAKEKGLIENIKEATKQLALLEVELGNYQAAYEYHVLFKKMADSLQNQEQIEKVTQLAMDYKYEHEKDSIQFANETKQLALEQDIKNRKVTQIATFIALGLSLVLVLILVFFFRIQKINNQKLNQANNEIKNQAEEIKNLNMVLEQNLDGVSKSLLIKNKKLEQYTFKNSHELRSPIVRLLGLVSILDTDKMDKDTNFILKSIQDNAKELDHITREMNLLLQEES